MTTPRHRGAKSKRKNSRRRREAIKRANKAAAMRKRAAKRVLDDSEPPEDADEFRLEMVRRIYSFMRTWRRCDHPLCRRTRKCRGHAPFPCVEPLTTTPERSARIMFKVRRAVGQRLADMKAEEIAAENSVAAVSARRRVTR